MRDGAEKRDGAEDGIWIFAYGSLMWRPGFVFEEAVPARLIGAHRSLCVYSVVHRGTPRHPGLVLGLEPGGMCDGLAFLVAPCRARETIAYLRRREQVTLVYREASRPVELSRKGESTVRALCYLVDTRHPQYACNLSVERKAGIVRRSRGRSGANIEYLANTVAHLREAGIRDASLERLLVRLGHHRKIDADGG